MMDPKILTASLLLVSAPGHTDDLAPLSISMESWLAGDLKVRP